MPEIEVFIDYPELDGWDTVDPTSHQATVSFADEDKAKRKFYVAVLDYAHENRDKLAGVLSGQTVSSVVYNDQNDEFLHAGAAAFKPRK